MSQQISTKIGHLGDLELAILVSLVSKEHCLLSSTVCRPRHLQEEIRLICSSIFGLQPIVVDCSAATTVEEFSEKVLVSPFLDGADDDVHNNDLERPSFTSKFTPFQGLASNGDRASSNALDERRIADVIIATNLNLANEAVQTQALELIRTKRIYTRTAMHTTTSIELMVLAILSDPCERLSHHLNDMFCISHVHIDKDGLPYCDQELSKDELPDISREDIQELRLHATRAHLTPEIAAYMHNIVVFLRNSRYISGGVTATATRQLRVIAKTLASLHRLNFVTPSLVALAVRKIYPHRLRLSDSKTEPSIQWGSDPHALEGLLERLTVEEAIEDVLAAVETPV